MKYSVVTLCGSLRAGKELWDRVAYDLSLQKKIVITLHVWKWEELHKGGMLEEKKLLDDMHRQRIRMADEVFVIDIVNEKQYIGESTRGEVAYAKSIGKPIQYLSEFNKKGDKDEI